MAWTVPMVDTLPEIQADTRSIAEAPMIQVSMHSGLSIAQASTGGSSALAFLFPLLIMGGLFYVLLILPQRRRHKRLDKMRSAIGVGDEVRTIGGIIGTVVAEKDEEFTLDIGGQHLRIVKRAVAEKLEDNKE